MKFSSVLLSEDSSARPYQMCGQILTFPEKKDLMHNMVTTSNRISCISMHWATTTNQPNQTEKKKHYSRWLPTKLSFWASFISYLVTNSICKLFVDVLFNHNTTFLNKGKEKQPFRSNPAAFIIASRTVYARIRCEQTTAFELLKLLQ